ncbi:motility associated factor glycosyltransferase family protein [Treponema sp. OMZ 787]|uniref:6-hydroxymethylpterin diphosphokinase MptE-like protein n=1 Tax=Treponema sp. OMZ 787 TaxID=2563669 RepID=UPI0020A52E40|nr:6-hydroxymethylpterin diphosphokinase MptE-like protein [Treponema sp. OMZ 787]UTC61569.1 motility associated factor glycosyltransferase family protein [Treponema sp. OMZ 787]
MIKQVKLHSSYNPQKEAERFSDTINGNPKIIVITEPGESYLASALRKKFPESKLIAMRYTDNYFLESDKLWDKVWRPASGNVSFFLVNNIPDEFLASTLFLPWKPAEKVWPDSASWVWKEISQAVKIIQSVIATRSFFGKKWLKNMSGNFIFAEKILSRNFFKEMNLGIAEPCFFAAAGPSLDEVLDKYSKNINGMFNTAAASALPAVLSRNIRLDLCISTDGGFWAANHIKYLQDKNFKETALAFPLEAKIPYNILKNNNSVFLSYGSALENLFFDSLGIEPIPAKRNGTVSGTAIELLLDNTAGKIFIAGLDLKESKGFSHCSPHESQKQKEIKADRLNPISNFAAISNFDLRSLSTYEKWFSQTPKKRAERLFRIGQNLPMLGSIKSICGENFKTEIKVNENANKKNIQTKQSKNSAYKSINEKKAILSKIYRNIKEEIKNKTFFDKIKISAKETSLSSPQKELCEFISFQNYMNFLKEKDTQNEEEIKLNLENEISSFLENQIRRLTP